VFASIDDYIPQIERAVHRIETATGLAPVIVAHSMGGLVARAWLRSRAAHKRSDGTDEAARLITLGTPHRGTWLAGFLVSVPHLLVISQFGIMAFELTSPVVFFLKNRARYAFVALFYLFHLMVFATITISFVPHQVAMTSFLPLEKVRPVEFIRRRARGRQLAQG